MTHPAREALEPWASRLGEGVPASSKLQAWAEELDPPARNACGLPIRFVPGRLPRAADYERAVWDAAAVATRPGSAHDLFNALAWLAFPCTKAALNRVHVEQGEDEARANRRSAVRDAASLLDESGILVAVVDLELARMLEYRRWRALFVAARSRIGGGLGFMLLGHALQERLDAPFLTLTARALLVPVEAGWMDLGLEARRRVLDARAAQALAAVRSPSDLPPLPLAAVPGWWPGNERPEFYENPQLFRPRRAPA